MSDKVVKLQGGVPRNTPKPHYDKDEVDTLVSQVESNSIQGDVDTLSAANDYTDQQVSNLLGGAPAQALDTIKELADALQSEQTATGSIISQLSDHETRISANETGKASVSSLNSEIANRQSADNTLQSNIDSEEASRIAGDASTLSSAQVYTDNQINAIPIVTTTVKGLMSSSDKVKLNGIAIGATANSTDGQLRDRSTHTGSQTSSTISDFASTVRNTIMSGIDTGLSGLVTSTDTVLSSLGKLQAQISSISTNTASAVRSTVLTGLSTATSVAITATDTVLSSLGKLQAQISSLQSSKYDASNPNNYETPTQLNARDTANRARSNHTGTQVSATISDFASTVRSTVLTGLNIASNIAVTAADSVLTAIGQLQAQVNYILFLRSQYWFNESSVSSNTSSITTFATHNQQVIPNAPIGIYKINFTYAITLSNNARSGDVQVTVNGVQVFFRNRRIANANEQAVGGNFAIYNNQSVGNLDIQIKFRVGPDGSSTVTMTDSKIFTKREGN